MRKMKRAFHFDFHTYPGVEDFGKKFDAAALAQTLQDSHITYINFFARCNRGFSYYPTKIGIPYPSENGEGLFPEMLKECHKRNIGVTAYFNATLSAAIALEHPEWRSKGTNENPAQDSSLCFNTPYGDHLLAEIKEVLEMYPEVDGIFADCLTLSPVCYCDACCKKMKEEGIDINDTTAVLKYSNRLRVEMAHKIRSVVPEGKYCLVNNFHLIWPDGEPTPNTHIELETLPVWGYELYSVDVALNRNLYDTTLFMTGRFHDMWGDFGGITTADALEYDAFSALAHGSEISIGDHMHPYGEFEKGLFDMVKPLYEKVKATEPWTDDAKYVPEIGILYPSRAHFYAEEREWTVNTGVVRMLGELKYQHDFITPNDDLSRFKLLILADDVPLDEKAAQKVKEYIQNGGKVLSTGNSALTPDGKSFALPEWDFEPIPERELSPFFNPDAPAPKKWAVFTCNANGKYPSAGVTGGQMEWRLQHYGYDYDVVNADSDLSQYSLVFLPKSVSLDDRSKKVIADFLQKGGNLITYGAPCTRLSRKKPESTQSFFRTKGFMSNGIPDMVLRSYFGGTALKLGKTAESLADHVQAEPVEINLADWQYIPYGKEDGYSLAAKSGNVIHIGTKVFYDYENDAYVMYKRMVDNAIRDLCPQKLMDVKMPSFARCSLTKKDSTYLFHALCYCPEKRGESAVVEEPIELYNVPVTLAIENATAVYSVPDKTPIPFTVKDNTVSFTLPYVNGHAMVAVETK